MVRILKNLPLTVWHSWPVDTKEEKEKIRGKYNNFSHIFPEKEKKVPIFSPSVEKEPFFLGTHTRRVSWRVRSADKKLFNFVAAAPRFPPSQQEGKKFAVSSAATDSVFFLRSDIWETIGKRGGGPIAHTQAVVPSANPLFQNGKKFSSSSSSRSKLMPSKKFPSPLSSFFSGKKARLCECASPACQRPSFSPSLLSLFRGGGQRTEILYSPHSSSSFPLFLEKYF